MLFIKDNFIQSYNLISLLLFVCYYFYYYKCLLCFKNSKVN